MNNESETGILLENAKYALDNDDKATALEFLKGAVELGSTEAMELVNHLTREDKPFEDAEIQSLKEKNKLREETIQLKEKYASLSGLSAFLILGIVLQAVAATFSLISSNWATLFALIPALIVNVAILSVLDIIGNLVTAVNQIQKKSK